MTLRVHTAELQKALKACLGACSKSNIHLSLESGRLQIYTTDSKIAVRIRVNAWGSQKDAWMTLYPERAKDLVKKTKTKHLTSVLDFDQMFLETAGNVIGCTTDSSNNLGVVQLQDLFAKETHREAGFSRISMTGEYMGLAGKVFETMGEEVSFEFVKASEYQYFYRMSGTFVTVMLAPSRGGQTEAAAVNTKGLEEGLKKFFEEQTDEMITIARARGFEQALENISARVIEKRESAEKKLREKFL